MVVILTKFNLPPRLTSLFFICMRSKKPSTPILLAELHKTKSVLPTVVSLLVIVCFFFTSHEAELFNFWKQTYYLLLHILIDCSFLFDM